MDSKSTNNIGDTIRIRRPMRVSTDALGRTRWMKDVEPVELELEPDQGISTNPYDSLCSLSR